MILAPRLPLPCATLPPQHPIPPKAAKPHPNFVASFVVSFVDKARDKGPPCGTDPLASSTQNAQNSRVQTSNIPSLSPSNIPSPPKAAKPHPNFVASFVLNFVDKARDKGPPCGIDPLGIFYARRTEPTGSDFNIPSLSQRERAGVRRIGVRGIGVRTSPTARLIRHSRNPQIPGS